MSAAAVPAAAAAAAAAPTGPIDISDRAVASKIVVQNAERDDRAALLLTGGSTIRSDADPQMIIYIPFVESVKLFGIVVNAPAEEGPTVLKIFANRPALGFDDATAEEGTQGFELKPDQYGKELKLKQAKFALVTHVHIFVDRPDSESGKSALTSIKLIGQPVVSSDVRQIKKVGED